MNLLQVQDDLKNFSQDQLVKEMQQPSGTTPQFLVLSELNRRKRVKGDLEARQAQNQPTVAEEAVASAGVPQSGMMGMPEAMAPASADSEGIGSMMPKSMRSGGEVERYAEGGLLEGIAESVSRNQEMLGTVAQNMGKMNSNIMQPRPAMPIQQPFNPIATDMEYRRPLGFGGKGPQRPGRKTYGRPDSTIAGLGAFADIFNKKSPAVEPQAMAEGGVIKAANGLSLADRNMNPGNIRPAGFMGETDGQGGYAGYASPEFGLRAMSRLSGTYANKGITTVRDFINRYAPPSDNNKNNDNYAKMVADSLGVGVDDPVDFSKPSVKEALIPAIANFEGYTGDLGPNLIKSAVAASDTEDTTKVNELLSGIDSLSGDKSGGEKLETDLSFPTAGNMGARDIDLSNIFGISSANASTNQLTPSNEQKDALAGRGKFAKKETIKNNKDNIPDFYKNIASALENKKNIIAENQSLESLKDTAYGNKILSEDMAEMDDFNYNKLVPNLKNYEGFLNLANKSREDAFPSEKKLLEKKLIENNEFGFGDIMKSKNAEVIGEGEVNVDNAGNPISVTGSDGVVREIDQQTKKVKNQGEVNKNTTKLKTPVSKSNYVFSDGSKSTGIGNTEQEIINLMGQLKKDRDFDKYMALAQVGLNLMDQKGYGEAAGAGLKTLGDSRQRYSDGVTSLINARAKLATATGKNQLTTKEAYDKLLSLRNRLYGKQGDMGIVTAELPAEVLNALKAEERFLYNYLNSKGLYLPMASASEVKKSAESS